MTATSFQNASLYVGDLAPEVTEALLFEIFREVGPVVSIRVCRDATSSDRRSLGYAYVNFQNPNDAERALDTLNFAPVRGKPMRIMWSHRDPSIRKSGVGNIYIKNLDKTIDSKTLYDTFSVFGNILSCKVVTDESGESKGFGFVHYETQEAADQAISKVNNMQLGGKVVTVTKFLRAAERARNGELPIRFTNVYIKNLDENLTEKDILDAFSPFGEITSSVLVRDESGKSKGFAFINFATPEQARKAVEAMNDAQLGSKKIYAGRAQKKAERIAELRSKFERIRFERRYKYQGVNLYIKNLDDTIDDEMLRKEFSQFGTITSAKIMRDEKGNSRGFGFVCFSNPEDASKATTEMNGRTFGSKLLFVCLAQRKEDRRAQLEAMYAQHRSPFRAGGAMAIAPGMPAGLYPTGPIFYPTGTRIAPGAQGGFVGYPTMGIPARPRWVLPPPNAAGGAPGAVPAAAGAPSGGQVQPSRGKPRYHMGVYPAQAQMQQRGPMPNGPGGAVQPNMTGAPVPPGRGALGRRAGPPSQQLGGAPVNGPKGGSPSAVGGPRGGFRYRNTARNARPEHAQQAMPAAMGVYQNGVPPQMIGMMPQTGPIPQPPVQAMPVPMDAQMEQLDVSMLTQATPEMQKTMIGQRLFPLISAMNPSEDASKITGMLLELDNSDLLHLLDSPDALQEQVNEAINVLKAAATEMAPATEESAAAAAATPAPAPQEQTTPDQTTQEQASQEVSQ